MFHLTLTVAIVSSALVLVLKPPRALAVFLITLFCYPGYLALTVGTVDFLVGRIVVGLLLIRCLLDDRLRDKFRWNWLDTWVTLSTFIGVLVVCMTRPGMESVINRGGHVMDTWFAYMAGRYCVTNVDQLKTVVKYVAIGLVPLAILGSYESVKHVIVFEPMMQYCPWVVDQFTHGYEPRWGFTRAFGPFSHPILFGCCFCLFLPLVYYLRHEKGNWKYMAYILCGFLVLGAMSSVSSGSWIMLMVVIAGLFLEKAKFVFKPMIFLSMLMCIIVIIASNRPFYHVAVSYINPLSGAGWHRARMIDAAMITFDEWWLAGYGGQEPGWGRFVGMSISDITNEFLLAGVNYGIWGIIALGGVTLEAFRSIAAAYKRAAEPLMKSLYWTFGCMLFSVIVAWMSVSFFGQMLPLFYTVLGLLSTAGAKKPQPVAAQVKRVMPETIRSLKYAGC